MASAIELPKLSTPTGGGAVRGMGESYAADDFTGAATFRIPIPASACREVTPSLVLGYASGAGTGPFGLGFDVALPRISRRTDARIPRYDDSDEFMADGEVLVQALEQVGSQWQPIEYRRSENGVEYHVLRFRKRVDGDGTRFERWRRLGNNDEHWRIASVDGSVAVLGFDPGTRIADPAAPARVLAWLIEYSVTALGDRVEYGYKAEDDINVPRVPSNAGRDHSANRYIREIRYGAYDDGQGGWAFAMRLVFDYGEYDTSVGNSDPYTPVRAWPVRPDPFSSYRSGFEVRTYRLCRGVLMFHALPELGAQPCLTGTLVLEHAVQDGLSVLRRAVQRGYRRSATGEYTMLEMPGVTLEYQSFEPSHQHFQPVAPARGAFPAPLSQGELIVADMLGEGLPGLLFSTPSTSQFWRNLGHGQFAEALTPHAMPVQHDVSAGRQLLTSLQGNGQLDCVVAEDGQAGYYRYQRDSGWSAFQVFPQWAPEAATSAAQYVDLRGTGLTDLLVMQRESLRWYPGEGEEGYGDPIELVLPRDVPDPRTASPREFIDFADVIGDGGAHLVRIRSGSVECWPSLGYGRFGERVMLDGAPEFPGEFDANRLRLADVSGSGGADLIYLGDRQAFIYLNLAGDGFAAPVVVPLPAAYAQLSYASSADLLGSGSHDLLLGTAAQGQWLIDFTGGRKPWLLWKVRGDLGASTELSYGSSSQFALADALAGRPWPCALPFPVQVVTRVTSTEPFSDATQTLRLSYHDGYYDPVAKSFRGFGHVERWTEQTVGGEPFAPPAYTKTWYDTGAFVGGDALTLQYAQDYWHGEAGRQPAPPDSAIRTLSSLPNAAQLRSAHRALKGQPLRSETYGLDGGPSEGVPFTVVSNSYTVRELQPASSDHDAVFQVSAREVVNAVYERDAHDPRVSQQFTLDVDDYGHVLLVVDVANARGHVATGAERSSTTTWPAFQTNVLVTAKQSDFASLLEHDGAFVVPGLGEATFQLGQVEPTANRWLDFDTVRQLADEALQDIIPPEQRFSGAQPQARMRLTTRQIYWDATQQQPLAFGAVAWPALLHHAVATRLSTGMVAQTYGNRLSTQQLKDEGLLELEGDYWWAPGNITGYSPANQFYRPVSATDAAGNSVYVTYDAYALLPVTITNADGTARSTPDYQALQTAALTDVNGVVDQVLSDALGRVIVATRFHAPAGGVRQGDGDIGGYAPKAASIDQILADPAAYLQQMTGYFYYDYRKDSGLPPVVLSVARQMHVSQLAPGQASALKLVASYSDSLGRDLETKTLVEAAACGRAKDAWLSKGQVQLDVQGQPVKRWLPRFTDGVEYTGNHDGGHDTDWRDAPGRVVETLTAKGFIARSVYRAWTGEQWDLDDTVLSSPYYLAHIDDHSPEFADERRALEQAASFAGTFLTQWLDPLGRVVDLEQRNCSTDAPSIRSMVTSSVLDMDGRTLSLADPRFSATHTGTSPIWNIVSTYDLAGGTTSLDSMDSGSRIAFNDALGRLVHQWDGRGVHSRRDYDAMNRLTQVYVDGALGLQQVVERLTYGTDAASNSIGRRIELRDSSGVLSDGPFDLAGQPTSSRFQLRVDYAEEVDWSPGKTVALEPARTTQSERNAFEQVIDKTCADGSRLQSTYYAIGWLASSSLMLPGQTTSSQVMTQATYSPEGKRAFALLGSKVVTVRGYEESTGRLLSIDASRQSDGKALQKIGYTYDPVGNVTCSEDATVPLVFCNQSQIGPRQDYGYDAIYRLLTATGRENPAIGARTYRTGFKQSAYLPLCPQNPADGTKLVPYQEIYHYDDSGNLGRLEHSTPLSTLSWTRQYSVSQTSNRVVLDDESGNPDPDLAYDANGNMVDFEHLRSMDWDWRNKPRRAVIVARNGNDDDAQYYIYNSAGQRIRRVTQRLVAGVLQVEDKVYLDGCELVRTLPLSGTPSVSRTGISVGDGGARLLMAYYWPASDGRPPQWRFQLSTATGSSALEVEADGSVISYEEYFPYGGTAIIAGHSQTEVALKDYRFCGKECDDATGLYYFGDRYYVTWLARWLSPDPNGPVDSPNLYQYVGCNPLSWVDPSGGCKAKITAPPSGTSTAFASFDDNYRYLSSTEADAYQTLAQDIHDYVMMNSSASLKLYDARLSPALETRVLTMFETFKPLHIASNPELLGVFRTAQSNAHMDDDTGGISSYTRMRSPHFTKAMNQTEMGDIVGSDDFFRTVELHHGAKKQFLPEFATHASNLWAVSRGGSSYGVVGQHEGAFHTVGAAKFGNIYTTEIGAYTGLMLHWEGLRTLPGKDPMDALKPPPPTPMPTFAQPSVPSFSPWMTFSPQPLFPPVVQTFPFWQPVPLWSPPPPFFTYSFNPSVGFSHPPVGNGFGLQ